MRHSEAAIGIGIKSKVVWERPCSEDGDVPCNRVARRIQGDALAAGVRVLIAGAGHAAAEALGRLADRRAEGALARALGDSDPGVRGAAEQALKLFGGKSLPAATS